MTRTRVMPSEVHTNTVIWGNGISHLTQDGVLFAYSVTMESLYIIPELQGCKVTCVARNVASFIEGKTSDESIRFVPLAGELYSLTNLHFADAQVLIIKALKAYREKLNQLNHGRIDGGA